MRALSRGNNVLYMHKLNIFQKFYFVFGDCWGWIWNIVYIVLGICYTHLELKCGFVKKNFYTLLNEDRPQEQCWNTKGSEDDKMGGVCTLISKGKYTTGPKYILYKKRSVIMMLLCYTSMPIWIDCSYWNGL